MGMQIGRGSISENRLETRKFRGNVGYLAGRLFRAPAMSRGGFVRIWFEIGNRPNFVCQFSGIHGFLDGFDGDCPERVYLGLMPEALLAFLQTETDGELSAVGGLDLTPVPQ